MEVSPFAGGHNRAAAPPRRRLPLSPLALVGWLVAAALAFVLFFFVGSHTAPSPSTLRAAVPLSPKPPAHELTGLFRAEALPPLGGGVARTAAEPVPVQGVSVPPRLAGARVVQPFTVRYDVRALASSVQVVRLALSRLVPAATVEIRCVRACRIAERLVAPASGEATSRNLRGWLRRGAVVEISERRPGRVGAYASVTVTGLPGALRIERSCLPPKGAQTPVPCNRFVG